MGVTVDIIESLNWRYAVKKFDYGITLTNEQIQMIIESVRMSASAFGLQPYRLIRVEDGTVREQLGEHSMGNREKVINAPVLLILAIEATADTTLVERYISLIAAERGMPRQDLAQMEQMLNGYIGRFPSNTAYQAWARSQAYLALGNMLTVCAVTGIDACPMEGFDPAAYDRILELEKLGVTSVVAAVLGHRAVDDAYLKLKKVRKPMNEFLIRV